MSENALPKGYEPHAVEDHWREYWEKNKTFTPDPDGPGEPFSIVIPPPNVTGALHIGHALNHTLIDVLCRHARQKGKKVLWLPGTDHAGIATQNVVERALAKEGKSRHDLGREAFVERVWQWKEDYGNRILNQIRMLGDSVDWTRERFTMDEGLSKAVRKVFVELYKEGYIYKGKYIINWCSRCHTALADDEVDHMPEKGHLYHVRYDFEDGSGSVIIATTRPETIMADTGVCVHPEDERYDGLVGKKIIVPIVGRAVPLFADRYVDKEFGTGALKVTPCHDPNDWTLGERHGLRAVSVRHRPQPRGYLVERLVPRHLLPLRLTALSHVLQRHGHAVGMQAVRIHHARLRADGRECRISRQHAQPIPVDLGLDPTAPVAEHAGRVLRLHGSPSHVVHRHAIPPSRQNIRAQRHRRKGAPRCAASG